MKVLAGIGAALVVVLGLLLWSFSGRILAVEVAPVERRSLTRALDEDGLVRSWVEVPLSLPVQGRIARVHVQRGDRVRPGQLLLELESDDPRAAVEQLRAQEKAAVAALDQARQRLQVAERRTLAELRAAEAGLGLSQAQREKLELGPRTEQRRVLSALLQRAEARYEEARRDLARRQVLYEGGAVSRVDLEGFESQLRTAEQQLREARARWDEALKGPLASERRAARAEVQRAAAGVEGSRAARGEVEVSRAALGEMEARLDSVRAQLRQSEARLRQMKLFAPETGVVEWETCEVGQVVNPGQVVLRLSDPQRLYVELLLDEGDRAQARQGASVKVTSDAYPEETFAGVLEAIEAQAFLKREVRNSPTQDEDRVFRARVRLDSKQAVNKLFAGMSVFAQIILDERPSVLSVPRQACINREGQWVVFRVRGDRLERCTLELGQKGTAQVEVLKGLSEGDRVVLNPGTLKEGARIRVTQAP